MQFSNETRRTLIVTASAVVMATLASCAAGDPRFTSEAPAGFWVGLWHGAISFITLVIGVFDDDVLVYELRNTGGWYDLGFLVGVACVWGSGHHATRRRARPDPEWEEIGRKVEAKLKRIVRGWAQDERDLGGRGAEQKLKQRLRRWADASEGEPGPDARTPPEP